jgi:lipid II:glycine glycyltransferase (peptidoglycan interpeptide bridge formation enzyme)
MQSAGMDSQEWNNTISTLHGVHILQSWEWGEFKEKYGWKVNRFIWKEKKEEKILAAAQILERTIKVFRIGPEMKILYIPRGPLLINWKNNSLFRMVIEDLKKYAKEQHAIFIKIDPEIVIEGEEIQKFQMDFQIIGDEIIRRLMADGWQYSSEQIQFKNTAWINLQPTEVELLEAMKQKTRYNLHLSERKGVKIRLADQNDLPILYDLYAKTSIRDGFIIRPKEYYLSLWQSLFSNNTASGLIAEVDGIPVAGLILFHFARKAWYFYGMSSDLHREKMPNYQLQWEAIRLAKKLGCKIYDLWGAPDQLDENDPMWGVFRFKLGLGGKLIKTIGAWDYPVNNIIYNIYNYLLPTILSVFRFFRKRQIKQETVI